MHATISGKQLDTRPLVFAAFGVLAACLVAVALLIIVSRDNESSARVTTLATRSQTADFRFIEENLNLPTGRVAITAPGYAEMQFAEQNMVLPTGGASVTALSYEGMQFTEQNLTLPGSAAKPQTLSYDQMQMLEQNLHLPTISVDPVTEALIAENSWGADFTFDAALPAPGTLPQPHDGAESY